MAALDTLVNFMKQQGVYEIYLPFLLTFAIFFALLRKTKIFYRSGTTGEDKIGNNISIVVSVVAALFVTIFTPAGVTISHYFTMFFTQATVAMVAIIVLIMITSMLMTMPFFEKDQTFQEALNKWGKTVLWVGLLLVIIMFVSSGGVNLFTRWGIKIPFLDEGDFGVILLVAGTIGIILLATHEKGTNDSNDKISPTPRSGQNP